MILLFLLMRAIFIIVRCGVIIVHLFFVVVHIDKLNEIIQPIGYLRHKVYFYKFFEKKI